MFNSKEEVLNSFRKLWNGETYNNQPADTVLKSNLVIPEKDGTETVYFVDNPEPELFRMCFTVEGIGSQLDKFKYDIGLIYYFDPAKHGVDQKVIDKSGWK
jgi:hypothetical protein